MKHQFIVIMLPLCMCAFDVVTGYAAAMRRGELNSTTMRDGLWNKMGEVFAIGASKCIEICLAVFGTDFVNTDLKIPVCTGVCAYIAIYELTSIVENIGKMNPTIGHWLVEHLGLESYKVGLTHDTSYDDEDVK